MNGYELSEERLMRFRDGVRRDRPKAAVTESLFARVGANFEHSNTVRHELAFGVRGLLSREPFEDRSDWGEYRTWEFALAQERYVLKSLVRSLPVGDPALGVEQVWERLRPRLSQMQAAVDADLVAISGAIDKELRDAIVVHGDGGWGEGGWRRALASSVWMIGDLDGVPILWAHHEGPTSASAINLRRWARFHRYCPSKQGELLQVDLTPRANKIEVAVYEASFIEVLDAESATTLALLGDPYAAAAESHGSSVEE
jgi:hypothetical protein